MRTVLTQLTDEGWIRSFEADMEGHLTQLFSAFLISLSTFCRYPEVLFLDCTYNTNRFKFPVAEHGQY